MEAKYETPDSADPAVDLSNDPRFHKVLISMNERAKPKSTEIINRIEEFLIKMSDVEKQEVIVQLMRELQGLMAVLKKGSIERLVSAVIYEHFRRQVKDDDILDEIELFSLDYMPVNEMVILPRFYPEAI